MKTMMKTPFTDIRTDLIERLPEAVRPYAYLARIDRPTGIWLLLLPALWAIFFAVGGIFSLNWITLWHLILFTLGAVIMRAAGCIINDLWDYKLDRSVERTKDRPLASGQISIPKTIGFLCGLLLLGLIILLQLSGMAIAIGLFSVFLIILYPLMKRWTYWPQAFLGITFNLGALMGWATVTGVPELPAIALYFAGVFWTLAYDTIYAYQDIEDDIRIGIKSTAIKFNERGRDWVTAFYLVMLSLLILAGVIGHAGVLYHLTLIAAILYTSRMVKKWTLADKQSALLTFKRNTELGLIILLACLLS